MQARLASIGTADAADRLANLKELRGEATQYRTIEDLCEAVDQTVAAAENPADGEPAVNLVTIHSAKGLEFTDVYLAGCEEALLPYVKSQSDDELEEERRIAYVAMTRAKDTLTLARAVKRTLCDRTEECEPSRFLDELQAPASRTSPTP